MHGSAEKTVPNLPWGAQKRKGFAVITSVILICAIALISAVSLVSQYFLEARETTIRASAVQARASAYSCASIGVLRLKRNNSYTGNENISVDKVICSISAVTSINSGNGRTLYAQAVVDGETSRVKVDIQDLGQFYLNSWTEVPPT